MEKQLLILFYPATYHYLPGALFETMGVTNETQESGDRSQETGGIEHRAWSIE